MCAPLLICTLYTYPVQDDFFNTWNVYQTMQEGHTAFGAAFLKAIWGWKDYSGYYFSLFLTYFSDALIKCDIQGIRICQFIMALCFYLSVFLFIRTVIVKVFHYEREKSVPIIFLFFICITSLKYFAEHEDFLWFCASVIYLIPMTIILAGIVCMVYAIETGKRRYIVLSMFFGFLAGGAVLNIAVFGCIVYVMTAYWGITVKREVKKSICICTPMIAGGIINVVAPGNFERKGGLKIEEVWSTVTGTISYVFERFKMFFCDYPLFGGVLLLLAVILLIWQPKELKYKFYVPVLFTLTMFLVACIVVYPVALGYGMHVYSMMDRSNFVSDFVIFLVSFLILFYWRGWLAVKFPGIYIKHKVKIPFVVLAMALFAGSFALAVRRNHVSSLRLYRELKSGEIASYANWNVSVIRDFEEAKDNLGENNIIEIHVNKMKDTTCLINPKFWYDYYDPEEEFANSSMAYFYGVDAVYIYNDGEE